MDKLCRGPYRISSILKWVTEKMKQRGWLKKRIMTAFEWKTFFVWRVTYICVHVTQAQILPTSSKHVSLGMRFLGLGSEGLSHQSCMSLHIGTNNIVGGSIISTLTISHWYLNLLSHTHVTICIEIFFRFHTRMEVGRVTWVGAYLTWYFVLF